MINKGLKRCYSWPNTDKLSRVESLSIATLFGFFGTIAFVGNGIVLICILRYKRLRSTSNLLLANLVAADLIVGITTPLNVSVYTLGSKLPCIVQHACGFQTCFFCLASILLLVVISIERYFHIVRYRIYNTFMTTKRVSFMATSAWCFSGILYVIYLLINSLYFHILLLAGKLSSVAVICICYWKIFRKVRESTKALNDHQTDRISYSRVGAESKYLANENLRQEQRSTPPDIAVVENHINEHGKMRENKLTTSTSDANNSKPHKRWVPGFLKEKKKSSDGIRKHYEIAKTMAIVILAVTLCWTPFMLVSFVRSIDMYRTEDHDTFASLYHWLLLLGFANSATNPVIYSWRNGNIREAIKNLFKCNDEQTLTTKVHRLYIPSTT